MKISTEVHVLNVTSTALLRPTVKPPGNRSDSVLVTSLKVHKKRGEFREKEAMIAGQRYLIRRNPKNSMIYLFLLISAVPFWFDRNLKFYWAD